MWGQVFDGRRIGKDDREGRELEGVGAWCQVFPRTHSAAAVPQLQFAKPALDGGFPDGDDAVVIAWRGNHLSGAGGKTPIIHRIPKKSLRIDEQLRVLLEAPRKRIEVGRYFNRPAGFCQEP